MTRDDFDKASIEQREQFLAWRAAHDVDVTRLPSTGVVAEAHGATVMIWFADGSSTAITEQDWHAVPPVIRGRF